MIRIKLLFLAIIIIGSYNLTAQVAINTTANAPHSSAMLDVSSDTAGILIPRLSSAQRNAISVPATGLLIFQTDNTPGFYYYNGASWSLIGTEAFAIDDLLDGRTPGNSLFLGKDAGASDDGTDNKNVFIGDSAGYTNTSGDINVFMGNLAGFPNTTGRANVILGYAAGISNIDGSKNVMVGTTSGFYNTSGNENTFLGTSAGGGNTTGSCNTYLGRMSGQANEEGDSSIFIGYYAGAQETTSHKLYIDNSDTIAPLIYGEFDNDILAVNGSLGVGTKSPHSSAKMEVESISKGFLPPRLTTGQMLAISNPQEGLMVYNFDLKTICWFNGTRWAYDGAYNNCGLLEYEGKIYTTVAIGTQCWMQENLATTKYNNGTDIPLVTGNAAWAALTTPGYCWYDNDSATYAPVYGALYNWYTVNTGNLCPTGWHLPSDAEWKTMEMYLGMSQAQADATEWRGTDEGGKLKETGTTHWSSPNTGATNTSGFTALPGGYRYTNGNFYNLGYDGFWWSATANGSTYAWYRNLGCNDDGVYRNFHSKEVGFSVRCVRD